MRYYDIHTHRVGDESVDNITYILNFFPEDFQQAEHYGGNVLFSCGVHPWYSDGANVPLLLLEEVLKNERVVAVGEAGLDKLQGAAMDVQELVFKRQIELSERVGKPLVIHSVRSWDMFFEIHKECAPIQPWILHGYRGKPELTKRLAGLGFYFSVGEYFNVDSVSIIPKEKLLCETDESELSIVEVYGRVADALRVNREEFVQMVEQNIESLFTMLRK